VFLTPQSLIFLLHLAAQHCTSQQASLALDQPQQLTLDAWLLAQRNLSHFLSNLSCMHTHATIQRLGALENCSQTEGFSSVLVHASDPTTDPPNSQNSSKGMQSVKRGKSMQNFLTRGRIKGV
jgi:hypothetical protein